MIGLLPKALYVNGTDYPIRSDYRIALLIFEAFSDEELSYDEKAETMLEILYKNPYSIPDNDMQEAYTQALWFLDGGDMPKSEGKQQRKIIDWEQDEKIIFPAVNKVAGYEVRENKYLHWWTFLGFFSGIGDGFFSTVMSIRTKKAKNKKLDKVEQEFYREHKDIIDLKRKYSIEEQAEIDRLNKILQ